VADLEAVKAFDEICFGDDRGKLLGELLDIAHGAYCVYTNRRLEGFAMVLPSAAGIRLGPCAADNPSAAGKLIDSVLADFSGKTIIAAVPGVNATALQLLESRGFERVGSCLRMLRGKASAESAPDKLVAIANGATG